MIELRIGDRTALLAPARFTESGICLQQSLLLLAFDHILPRRPKFLTASSSLPIGGCFTTTVAVPVCVWTGWKAATVPRHAIASVKVTTVFIIVAVALLSGVSMYQAVRTRKSAENPDTLPCVPIFADDFSERSICSAQTSQAGDCARTGVSAAERETRIMNFSVSTTRKKTRPPSNSHGQAQSGIAAVSNSVWNGGV